MSEYQADHGPRQIVRPLNQGEWNPVAFTTVQLLRHANFVRADPPKSAQLTTAEKAARFNANYKTVLEMLHQFATNEQIASFLGVPERYVKTRLYASSELHPLAMKRIGRGGCAALASKSKRRFEENREAIVEALKTQGIRQVSIKFRFSPFTIQRFLRETPEMIKQENKNAQG